jgi:ATP-binding cassette subfamily B protein
MKLLFSYLAPLWKLVALTLLLATINQVFSLLDPLIFRHVIDDYATKYQEYSESEFLRGVLMLLAAAVGVAFVSRVAKNFQDYFVNVISQRIGARIYSDGLRHSLQLPYAVFEDQQSGETLGKLQKTRTDVEKLMAAAVNVLFTTLVGFVFVITYAISVHWLIAPIYFSVFPIIGGVSLALSRRIKIVQQSIVRETTALAGSTTESLRNIELVKSLGLAEQEINRLERTTDRILELELKKVRYIRKLSFIQGTTINFLRTSIMFVMLYLIFLREISFGEFFSLYIYSFFIFGPLQELGNIIALYREAEVSLGKFEEILTIPVEPKPANPKQITNVDEVSFEGVSFSYASASRPALQEVNFKVSRGQTVAFVGPSGSGKTTVIKLLAGLYAPTRGVVRYSGVSGLEIDFDVLRERLGLVTQDTQLFAGTIRENLLFVRPEATDAECLEALRSAACATLLDRAAKGLDTMIGEGGIKLSGGERQRLSIARALLRKPQILVFDEATSALDSLTEEEINRTIRDVSSARSHLTVLVAHRLSTVMHADRIIVLERGHVAEQGRHDELLALKGLYYAMWRQQIGEGRAVSA